VSVTVRLPLCAPRPRNRASGLRWATVTRANSSRGNARAGRASFGALGHPVASPLVGDLALASAPTVPRGWGRRANECATAPERPGTTAVAVGRRKSGSLFRRPQTRRQRDAITKCGSRLTNVVDIAPKSIGDFLERSAVCEATLKIEDVLFRPPLRGAEFSAHTASLRSSDASSCGADRGCHV
jgi:hypothetical protein